MKFSIIIISTILVTALFTFVLTRAKIEDKFIQLSVFYETRLMQYTDEHLHVGEVLDKKTKGELIMEINSKMRHFREEIERGD